MAIFHLAARTISRASGRSATAAAAYRSGDEIADERTGEIHDYRRRSGVAGSFIVAPAGSPVWAGDRAALWNAAEAAERRRNSTVAREVVLALPAELDAAERRAVVEQFAKRLVKAHGFVADVALHEPGREGDQRNHHAHVLLTTRRLEPDGFGAKTRELDVRPSGAEAIKSWRATWAEVANHHLEVAGVAARVDHRSLAEQGVAREPTRHLGPAATAMQRSDRRAASTRAFEVDAGSAAATDPVVAAARATARLDAVRERAAMARSSAAELRALEQLHRPPPLAQMIEREADVVAARIEVEAQQGRVAALDNATATCERRVAEWREQHPVLARWHASARHPYRQPQVASNEAAVASNVERRVGAIERLTQAQRAEREVRSDAEARLRPEHRWRTEIADQHGAEAVVRERQEGVAARRRSVAVGLERMIESSTERATGRTPRWRITASGAAWTMADQLAERGRDEPEQLRQYLDRIAEPRSERDRAMADETVRMVGTVHVERARSVEQRQEQDYGPER